MVSYYAETGGEKLPAEQNPMFVFTADFLLLRVV